MEGMTTQSLSKQAWYAEINILRGILVVLVVLGHITQIHFDNVVLNDVNHAVNSFIYSFHMPAFFAISGFCGYKALRPSQVREREKSIGEFVKRKFFRLMVPYFTMGIIYLPFRLILSSIARTEYSAADIWKIFVGYNPDGALWFLYALFVISLAVCLFVEHERLYVAAAIGSTVYIVNSFIPWWSDHVIVDKIFESGCFYLFGVVLNMVMLQRNLDWLKFFTSISGTIVVFELAYLISVGTGRLNKFFNALGDYGMDIYIFSEPIKVVLRTVLKKTDIPEVAIEIVLLVMVITISYFGSKLVVRKIKPMRRALLGMNK